MPNLGRLFEMCSRSHKAIQQYDRSTKKGNTHERKVSSVTLPKVAVGSKWRVLARISDWNTHGEDTSTPERDNSTTPKRCSDGGRDACAWPRTGEKTNRGPVFRGNEGELRERFVRIEHSFLEASLRQPEWTKECHRRTQSGKKYKDPYLQHKLKKCNHHIIEAR